MKWYYKHPWLFLLSVWICAASYGQYKIKGPLVVAPGGQATFTILYNGSPASNCLNEMGSSCTMIVSGDGYCQIQAPVYASPDDYGYGYVDYDGACNARRAIVEHVFAISNRYLEQKTQIVAKNGTGFISFIAPIKDNPDILSIVWEVSENKTNWTVVNGANTTSISVPYPANGVTKYYRCSFTYDGLRMEPQEFSEVVAAGAENKNYVKTNVLTIPGVNSKDAVKDLPVGQRFQSANYFDGLGRTIQAVAEGASLYTTTIGNGVQDLVTISSFDELGRVSKTFLPFTTPLSGAFKENASNLQSAYITNKYGEVGYGNTVYENSPLSRITKQTLPGSAWTGQNVGVSYDYDYNNSNETIKIWSIGYSVGSLPYTVGNYDANKLSKQVTIDEKGKKSISYKDFSGKLILTKVQEKDVATGLEENGYGGWNSTYYVYDDFGQQRYVITPRAVTWLINTYGVSGQWQLSAAISEELCYYTEYDDRSRAIRQHAPGAGISEVVYDKRNRAVFTQDAADKQKTRWGASLYDALDRTTIRGIIQTGYTRVQLQDYVENNTFVTTNVNTGVTTGGGGAASLIVDNRVPGVQEYTASEDITLLPGFSSEDNAEFTAHITEPPVVSPQQIAIAGNPVPAGINLVSLGVTYYDDYAYASAKAFSNNYSFPSTSNQYVQATNVTKRTLGMVTGQQLRVIDDENYSNDPFLASTIYYDEDGRSLQVLGDNYLKGVDVVTKQYDFSGKLLASCMRQTVPGTSIQDFNIGTKYEYDVLGRQVSLSKSYGGQAYKKLLQYGYDELGQMMRRVLSPDYNSGAGIESQDYEYNIQGWLTGINKNYTQQTGATSQWQKYFGLSLGYENKDAQYNKAEYNGCLTGATWKSQGDNKSRRYDYYYSNSGMLQSASFLQKEQPTASWANSTMDASVPLLQYDENGNMLRMQQKGRRPGQLASVLVDDLTYSYDNNSYSNKLIAVTENAPAGANNKADFENGANMPDQQYVYNDAGNLVKDYNKNIQNSNNDGILYNVIDKPYKTIVQGKYELQYVYDAGGALLAKKITNIAVSPSETKWQYYVNGLVLENTTPQYFTNETGRLRVSKVNSFAVQPAPALILDGNNGLTIDGKPAFYDFYLADQQGSVRMVLTEEQHTEYHLATMEISNEGQKTYEESMFGQPGTANELAATRNDVPPAWSSHYNDANNKKASKLNQNAPVGPNALLKVMAGDVLNLRTDYFFTDAPSNNNSGLNEVVNALMGALISGPAAGAAKDAATQLQGQLASSQGLLNFVNNPDRNGDVSGVPKAYINWLFFDENFNPIPYDATTTLGSSATRVTAAGDGQSITVPGIKVPQNGYAFCYVSNTSNSNVWFDNFAVTHQRGRILQENHYYPYGLEIAAISSKAYGKLENYARYQGAFSEYDEITGYTEFDLRSYDAQIGRWTGIDPYNQFASGYLGMGGDPVNGIDPSGGTYNGINWLGIEGNAWTGGERLLSRAINTAVGAIIGGIANSANKGWNWQNFGAGAAWGGGVGLAATYVPWGDVGNALGNTGEWVGKNVSLLFGNLPVDWIIQSQLISLDLDGSPRAYNPTNTGVDYNAYAGINKKGKGPRYGIVVKDGENVIQGENDPYPGYYVSKTKWPVYPVQPTDPKAYPDAEKVPYVVFNKKLKKLGYKLGTTGKIENLKNGKITWFVVVDENMGQKGLEMSPALANSLEIPIDFSFDKKYNSDKYKGIVDPNNSIKVKVYPFSDRKPLQ